MIVNYCLSLCPLFALATTVKGRLTIALTSGPTGLRRQTIVTARTTWTSIPAIFTLRATATSTTAFRSVAWVGSLLSAASQKHFPPLFHVKSRSFPTRPKYTTQTKNRFRGVCQHIMRYRLYAVDKMVGALPTVTSFQGRASHQILPLF